MFKEFDICSLQNLIYFYKINNTLCVYLYSDDTNHYVYVNNELFIRSVNISKNLIKYESNFNNKSENTLIMIHNVKKYIKLNDKLYIIRMYDGNIYFLNKNKCNLPEHILNKCNLYWNNNKIYNIIDDNPLTKLILEKKNNENISIDYLFTQLKI